MRHSRAPHHPAALGLLACSLLAGSITAGMAQTQTLEDGVQLHWNADQYGNHRYAVAVDKPAAAVLATIPWHRRDHHPESVATIVVGPDGQAVGNVVRERIGQAEGVLAFEAKQTGTYAIYYLPYIGSGRSNYPTVTYRTPTDTADVTWVKQNGLDDPRRVAKLPQARVIGYEALDDFDAYTDMERTASPEELQHLLAANPDRSWLLFPETREHPIRMFTQVPERWAQRGEGGPLTDDALRGEYLSFQVGLWAARGAAQNVRVSFDDMHGPDGATIPAARLTCFNLGGTDYAGKTFANRLDVARGRVQPLWMGLDVPTDASPGTYRGTLTISADGVAPRQVPLAITVHAKEAVAHGDDDPFKLTRLHWLNSTLAQNDDLVKPFTAVTVHGAKLGIFGRTVTLAPSGLPAQIDSFFDERMTGLAKTPRALLAAPMQLLVQDASGAHALRAAASPNVTVDGPGKVHWQVTGQAGALKGEVTASLEMDGTLSYAIALTATQAVKLADIRLEIPLRNDVAQYELGLGRTGSAAPDSFAWKWNVENNQDGAWIGAVNAGLEFHLRDENYRRPLNTNFYHQQPLLMPASWDNAGQGGITFAHDGARYVVKAFSGARTMAAGQTLHYDLVLRVTPFKTIDPAQHFAERYFHKYADLDQIKAEGANVVNIHHATPINPWINYPFLEPAKMKAYIDAAHARGMEVKIYDTIRELTDRAPELPMLESLTGCRLGDDGNAAPGPCSEIVSPGKGGGFSWLQEHLDGNYIAAWHVPENRDAAVVDAGQSRWHNFYIEGLDWLARNIGIDGLYLDDVAYDRTTMLRVRKVLDAHRPHALIDLHSASQYDARDGYINSALLYMELFPYINRLWFGEEFDYEHTSPQYWLTEISGIPYGLMGEMLQNGGNPWRGMVFGMTNRLPWTGGDPRRLWQLWDAFGIEQADMVGWWVHDTPVKTSNPDVLATSYVRKGDKTLVSIASWAPATAKVKLTINWKALGLNPARVRLVAPAVEGFQPAATFKPGDEITVEPGKGWLLELEAPPAHGTDGQE
ncbi:glycoside hydrolase domain-containing protein [Rhodanobacter hydrolyticus]|uniref:Glycoside hydrolase 123-like N-terminal domain-containing protein n=1 Tax=Rhodanobacter hydrolyticus TaxID=2250595 RepID=A0ABW8J311_9GAMM